MPPDGRRAVRVLVDAVSARVGGGGTHLVSQLEALDRIPDIELTVHASAAIGEQLDRECTRARVILEPVRPLWRRVLWEQLVLARRVREYDVLYTPGNFAVLTSPRPQVLALHNAWHFGHDARAIRLSRRRRTRLAVERLAARASVRRATRTFAVSHSLAALVAEDLSPAPDVRVVSPAPPRLQPRSAGLPRPLPPGYALVLSHDDPHKEWDRLIDVFTREAGLPTLVIAGTPRRERAPTAEGVVLLGPVEDRSQVGALYGAAGCCLAHSRLESVGLTPLEALSIGVPVAASDIPAHREGCGQSATYYPADDDGALAEAVRTACSRGPRPPSGGLLTRTWDDTARELAALLREAAAGR